MTVGHSCSVITILKLACELLCWSSSICLFNYSYRTAVNLYGVYRTGLHQCAQRSIIINSLATAKLYGENDTHFVRTRIMQARLYAADKVKQTFHLALTKLIPFNRALFLPWVLGVLYCLCVNISQGVLSLYVTKDLFSRKLSLHYFHHLTFRNHILDKTHAL